jgi:hypothetical protein
VLDLQLVGRTGVFLDKVLLVGELKVRLVLLGRRDPSVANEEALEFPSRLSWAELLVSVDDTLRNVGNVLAGERLSGEV